MTLTLQQKRQFLKRRNTIIRKSVLSSVKKNNGIVFGGRANNKQLPKHLQEHTSDYDVFVQKNPQKFAKRLERKLDRKLKGNFFRTEPAKHEGTYKIKSNVSNKGIVDVSQKPKEIIRTIKRKGVKFAHTDFQKKQIKKSLADPDSKFRHDKDRFTRLRIKLSEKPTKQKKKVSKRRNNIFPVPKSFNPL